VAKDYVLDTSAFLCYIQGEEGSGVVEKILHAAKRKESRIYISFMTLMELYYILWQEKGEAIAKETVVLVEALPVERIESNPRLGLLAGRIKATQRLSVADAFIAATAIEKKAILVHKDPELAVLGELTQTLELPYKNKKA